MRSTPQGSDRSIAVYRTLPARIIGWGMALGVIGIGFVVVRTEAQLGRPVLPPVAIALTILAVVWVVLLRPHVELRRDGVTHRNLLTDTDVPFSRLQEVGHQWALELTDTAGRRHSAWAVPKQREFSARRRFDDFAETTSRRRGRPGTTAIVVADDVQREWQRWRLEGGVVEPDAPARRQWAWSALGPLGGAAVLLLLALLL
ncbi:hypothetical protein [Ornithinimicrobium sediminis]|uniref:hypothetical protein n=1 Tax=Ornithinimicrobium sediminis TaxID=2904603 RepID=UPI001E314DF7|nr:hypothetical protein [Ornithinimicrobium sediminis]MCE0486430.1 hypothetical protein [Ornithinimicrobium sediminis]